MVHSLVWSGAIVILGVCSHMAFAHRNSPAQTSLHKQMRYVMGTLCEIQVYDSEESHALTAMNGAFEEMERVDLLLSNYNPDSELSRLNQTAAKAAFHCSGELFSFLEECRRLNRLSEGAFDPTVGALIRLWGFFSAQARIPPADAIAAARTRVGFDKLELQPADHKVRFKVDGMEIDPGGIGKGYAVDRAASVLKAHGMSAALINTGSSTFYALGHPPGTDSWVIGIKDPALPRQPLAWVRLQDQSLSTSGDSERFVEVGGRRFGHIFDPRTGTPAQGVREVSVVAPTATESDALTKAVYVLPRDKAFTILRGQHEVHALRVEGPDAGPVQVVVTPWSGSVFLVRSTRESK